MMCTNIKPMFLLDIWNSNPEETKVKIAVVDALYLKTWRTEDKL